MKSFQGRVVTPGTVTAEALVTTEGFNTLASFQMALQFVLCLCLREKSGMPFICQPYRLPCSGRSNSCRCMGRQRDYAGH